MIKEERPLPSEEERTQGPLTTLCPDCNGEGIEDRPPLRKCHLCRGKGKVSKSRFVWDKDDKVQVTLPKEENHDK